MRSSNTKSAGLPALLLACVTGLFALACAGELSGNEESYFATRSGPDAGGAAGSGGATSSGGASASGGGSSVGCDRAAAIIDKNCKACHNADGPQGKLDLFSPNVASRLVDQPSSDAECASLKRIDSANPAESFLIEKLESSNPSCGDPMPFGSRLQQLDIDCMKAWVASLAAGGGS
jgi:hypothetical protein